MNNNKLLNEKILKYLESVLNNYFNVKVAILEENMNTPLTGRPFNLSGSDLYRVLMNIENEFEIRLSSKEIRENGFKTANDIIRLVNLHFNYKEDI